MPVPSTDLSAYTIVPANPQQLEADLRAQFVHWRRDRSWPRFLEEMQRERDEGEWAKDEALITWVLVKRDDLDGEMYAGVDTFRRKAFLKRKGSSEVEETWMYGIASVVTPVQHLRKGYATHLLRLLHYQLGDPALLPPFPPQWGAPPPLLPSHLADQVPHASYSILWSDVGFTFYERCTVGESLPGWRVPDEYNHELTWKVLPPAPDADVDDVQWGEVYEHELAQLGEALREPIRVDLAALDASAASLVSPDISSRGILAMHFIRGAWSTRPPPPQPMVVGLRSPSTTPGGEDTIVLFTAFHEEIHKRLLIKYHRNLAPSQLPSLLARLDGYAAQYGRTEGWIWDLEPDGELARAWKALEGREVETKRRPERDGHLLGFAWYRGGEGRLLDRAMWQWC